MAKKLKGDMGIVPALDIDSHEHLERVVRETSKREGVAGYKLGLTSVLHFGLRESVRRLRDLTDLPIIYDHQKAGPDMPDMAKKYTALCKEADVDGLILFPVAGPTAVDSFVGEAIRADLTPFVGGEIPVPDYGVSGGGYMLDDALDRILVRAVQNKSDHFVLPAHDVGKDQAMVEVDRIQRVLAAGAVDGLWRAWRQHRDILCRRIRLQAPLCHRRPPDHRQPRLPVMPPHECMNRCRP